MNDDDDDDDNDDDDDDDDDDDNCPVFQIKSLLPFAVLEPILISNTRTTQVNRILLVLVVT